MGEDVSLHAASWGSQTLKLHTGVLNHVIFFSVVGSGLNKQIQQVIILDSWPWFVPGLVQVPVWALVGPWCGLGLALVRAPRPSGLFVITELQQAVSRRYQHATLLLHKRS